MELPTIPTYFKKIRSCSTKKAKLEAAPAFLAIILQRFYSKIHGMLRNSGCAATHTMMNLILRGSFGVVVQKI